MAEIFNKIGRLLGKTPPVQPQPKSSPTEALANLKRKEMIEREDWAKIRAEEIEKAVAFDHELFQQLRDTYSPSSEEPEIIKEARRIAATISAFETRGKFMPGTKINGQPLVSVPKGSSHTFTPSLDLDFQEFGSEKIYNSLMKHNVIQMIDIAFTHTLKDHHFNYLKDKYYESALMTHTNTEDPDEVITTFFVSNYLHDSARRDTRCIQLNFLIPKVELYKLLLLAEHNSKAIDAFYKAAVNGKDQADNDDIPEIGLRKFSNVTYLDLSKLDPRLLNGYLNYQPDTNNFYVNRYPDALRSHEILRLFDEGYQGSGDFVKVFDLDNKNKP